MNLSEEEYKKVMLGMIIFALIIFLSFTSLIVFMYRDTIITGTPPVYKTGSENTYQDTGYYPESKPMDMPIDDIKDQEYIEPENRSL